MGWSIKLFTWGGTAVRMHLTFLLLIAWIAAVQWQHGGAHGAIAGVLFILVLFACVVLHEFGHIWAAARYGIRTPDVTLLPIGGVASMERMPEKPSQEIVVALAGPAVNLVIALVLIAALGLRLTINQMSLEALQSSFLAQVAIANIILLVFNLIPAFPMDGGRVLRALLAMKMGFPRGTRVAARIGQAMAIGFAFLGFMGNPMLILVAAFIFLAASGEAGDVEMREVIRGRRITDAMITRFESIGVGGTADDAAAKLLHTTQHEFPVLDGGGHLRGFIDSRAIIEALRAGEGERPVLEIMAADVPTLHLDATLDQAVDAMRSTGARFIGIIDADDRLVGYLTPENLNELIMIGTSRERARTDRPLPDP
ncbi:site-2 protease family protein [Hyphomicrobium sp. NDB2Meth4]|uniref:site-2 protease family protein n=1 Tax=Hyphomicrobium sp. NDB2Meth4 TaxID=1892846 RepID=UPI00092FFDC0|nr:site-2 protease family protein [Hyphomicrobium sp. NDB2Meth4]